MCLEESRTETRVSRTTLLVLCNESFRVVENRLNDLQLKLGLPSDCDEYEIAAHVRRLRESVADREQMRRIEAELSQVRQDREELRKQMAAAERQRQSAAFLYRQLQLEIKRRNQRLRRDAPQRPKPTIGRREHAIVPVQAGGRTPAKGDGNKLMLPPIDGAKSRPASGRNPRLAEITLSLAGNVKVSQLQQRCGDRAKRDGGNRIGAAVREVSMMREESMMREASTVMNTARWNRMREPDAFQLRYCIACRQTFKEGENEDGDDDGSVCRIHYMSMRYDPHHKCEAYQCCGDGTAWSSGCLRMRHIYVQIVDENTFVISNGISHIANSRD
jgi:hypothetical protein